MCSVNTSNRVTAFPSRSLSLRLFLWHLQCDIWKPLEGYGEKGNIFIFNSSFAGETIRIVVANSVLYISVIGKDGIVEIPENISGEVELQLVRGNVIYHAYVEL